MRLYVASGENETFILDLKPGNDLNILVALGMSYKGSDNGNERGMEHKENQKQSSALGYSDGVREGTHHVSLRNWRRAKLASSLRAVLQAICSTTRCVAHDVQRKCRRHRRSETRERVSLEAGLRTVVIVLGLYGFPG